MIRTATGADCQEVYRLICGLEQRELPFSDFQRACRSYLSRRNVYCLVFPQDGDLLGCITLRIEYQLHHAARVAEILELMVEDGARSSGIGGQLLAKAVELAEAQGCQQIEVASNRLRQRAHVFYSMAGFQNFHIKMTKMLGETTPEVNRIGI